MFEEAQFHYATARDIRKVIPNKQAILDLYKRPTNDMDPSNAIDGEIKKNVHKQVISQYQAPVPEKDKNRVPDYAWFSGVHTDITTLLYTAPPQGWTGQDR